MEHSRVIHAMKVLFNIVANHKSCKAKDLFGQGQGLLLKAKAKDSEFVLEDSSRPRTKAKDNNTA